MKNMREMINLMEGVMAVPGLNEKSTSEKQARTMAAAAHNSEFAKKVGISQDVAKEFNKADTGTKQLSNAMKEGSESEMQTAGTVGRNQDYAEFDQSQGMATEESTQSSWVNGPRAPDDTTTWKQTGMSAQSAIQRYGKDNVRVKPRGLRNGQDMVEVLVPLYDMTPPGMEESVPAVDSCQQSNPATADIACAMESGVSDLIYDQQYSRFSDLMNSYVEPQEAFDVLSREMAEQGIEGEEHDAIMQRLESDFFPDNSAFDMMNSSDDMSADAEAPASDFPIDEARSSDINPDEIKALTGMQVDAAKARAQEIIAASTTGDNKKSYLANQINRARTTMDVVGLLYNMILAGEGNAVQGSRYGRKFGNAMEEAFDLQNGYDDINDASGNDYFPNGADSPVVTKVGPSGARQGDNPEQKKMQVAEVHKELVYGYRNYLKEAAVVKKKT